VRRRWHRKTTVGAKKHGYGAFTDTGGTRYEEGQWESDQYHGRGRLAHSQGAVIEAEFVRGRD
jgi:hypothetical protein